MGVNNKHVVEHAENPEKPEAHKPKNWVKIGRGVLSGLILFGSGILFGRNLDGKGQPVKDDHVEFFERGVLANPIVHMSGKEIDKYYQQRGLVAANTYGLDCTVKDVNPSKKVTDYQPVKGKYTSSSQPIHISLLPNTQNTLSGLVNYGKVEGQDFNATVSNGVQATLTISKNTATVTLTENLTYSNSRSTNLEIDPGEYYAAQSDWITYVIANKAGRYSLSAACDLDAIKVAAGEIPINHFAEPENVAVFGKLDPS